MLSNGHCRLFTRWRKFFFLFPPLLVSLLFYVLSVLRLTWLIGRTRTSSSTHQLAKCQHTLKLRYGVKRKSQPLILYHFLYMRSGRIDVYDNQVCITVLRKSSSYKKEMESISF